MLKWETYFFSELSAHRLYQIIKLRQDVFVLEQACLYPDLDNLDQQSLHLLLIDEEDDLLFGYCRILPEGLISPEVAIGRVVIAEQARNNGLATKLMQKAIEFITLEMQAPVIKISAQFHLKVFYETFNFKVASSPYDEDGIKHIDMLLTIKNML